MKEQDKEDEQLFNQEIVFFAPGGTSCFQKWAKRSFIFWSTNSPALILQLFFCLKFV
jgi:hypothetical protein